jgi:hypothetical protein
MKEGMKSGIGVGRDNKVRPSELISPSKESKRIDGRYSQRHGTPTKLGFSIVPSDHEREGPIKKRGRPRKRELVNDKCDRDQAVHTPPDEALTKQPDTANVKQTKKRGRPSKREVTDVKNDGGDDHHTHSDEVILLGSDTRKERKMMTQNQLWKSESIDDKSDSGLHQAQKDNNRKRGRPRESVHAENTRQSDHQKITQVISDNRGGSNNKKEVTNSDGASQDSDRQNSRGRKKRKIPSYDSGEESYGDDLDEGNSSPLSWQYYCIT